MLLGFELLFTKCVKRLIYDSKTKPNTLKDVYINIPHVYDDLALRSLLTITI